VFEAVRRFDRLEGIRAALRESGQVEVAPLAEEFGVSEMTVRRDLEELERQGVCERVYGGAVSAVSRSYEPPFALREERSTEGKQRIAKAAVGQLGEGETVLLDIGTTTLEVARALRGRRNLTVLTPGLRHASELADETGLRVLCTGGMVRAGEHSLVGSVTEQVLHGFHVDVCLLGAAGVDVDGGLTEFNLDDAAVKRVAMERSRKTIVVADRSKLGAVAFAVVAPVTAAHLLITDATEPDPYVAELRQAGLDVLTV
jgi:DeoR/GlpR family transcriptional regulator of sugar metabolism